MNKQKKSTIISSTLSLTILAFTLFSTSAVKASEPFIGQIQFFPYNFTPRNWSFCNGQLLPISQHTALFSLIGTIYGGDGRTTVALPNMQGRSPVHAGRGPGLTSRRMGERGGTEQVTLTSLQIPAHNHSLRATNNRGNQTNPGAHTLAKDGRDKTYSNTAPNTLMHSSAITSTGGGQAHNNMPPFLAVNCNIALQGTYPSR